MRKMLQIVSVEGGGCFVEEFVNIIQRFFDVVE